MQKLQPRGGGRSILPPGPVGGRGLRDEADVMVELPSRDGSASR